MRSPNNNYQVKKRNENRSNEKQFVTEIQLWLWRTVLCFRKEISCFVMVGQYNAKYRRSHIIHDQFTITLNLYRKSSISFRFLFLRVLFLLLSISVLLPWPLSPSPSIVVRWFDMINGLGPLIFVIIYSVELVCLIDRRAISIRQQFFSSSFSSSLGSNQNLFCAQIEIETKKETIVWMTRRNRFYFANVHGSVNEFEHSRDDFWVSWNNKQKKKNIFLVAFWADCIHRT